MTNQGGQPDPSSTEAQATDGTAKDMAAAQHGQMPDDGVQAEATGISQWEFLDRVPTRAEVLDLLATLEPVFGVATIEFADYVQALPQKKKAKVPHPERPDVMIDQYMDTHSLYMSVGGRIKMAERIAEVNGWALDFTPEPVTPTGIPGFLQNDERIVYREYAEFRSLSRIGVEDFSAHPDQRFSANQSLGRKPGTAWVPRTGGSQAAGSNPYEKVETSARGRALAAWGIGVLPGSGVASLEEVQGMGQNRASMEAESGRRPGQRDTPTRESREDLLQSTLAVAEELRQERGIDEKQARQKMAEYLSTSLGVRSVYDEEADEIDWRKVKDGQIVLLRNSLTGALRKIRDAGSQV